MSSGCTDSLAHTTQQMGHTFIPVFIIVVVRHFFKKVVASEFLNFADLKIELCDLLLWNLMLWDLLLWTLALWDLLIWVSDALISVLLNPDTQSSLSILLRCVLGDLHAVFNALHSVSDHFISDSDALNSVLHRDQRQRVHCRQSSFAQSSLLTEFIRTEFNIRRVHYHRVQYRQSSLLQSSISAEFIICRVPWPSFFEPSLNPLQNLYRALL